MPVAVLPEHHVRPTIVGCNNMQHRNSLHTSEHLSLFEGAKRSKVPGSLLFVPSTVFFSPSHVHTVHTNFSATPVASSVHAYVMIPHGYMHLNLAVQVPVNWCPALGTVLANEEVIDGVSERGGHPVVRLPMKQWMLRITAYADRLLENLDTLDWPESIKEMQRNWIGRSEGANITFQVPSPPSRFQCTC